MNTKTFDQLPDIGGVLSRFARSELPLSNVPLIGDYFGKPQGEKGVLPQVRYVVEKFTADAVGNFGSGWTWLVKDGAGVAIVKTDDADTPIKHGQTPLLTIDVWEHAYYLDYQNARPAYVAAFLDNLVNWEFASQNFSA